MAHTQARLPRRHRTSITASVHPCYVITLQVSHLFNSVPPHREAVDTLNWAALASRLDTIPSDANGAISGHTFPLDCGTIPSPSKRQDIAHLATTESDHVAATHGGKEAIRRLFTLLGDRQGATRGHGYRRYRPGDGDARQWQWQWRGRRSNTNVLVVYCLYVLTNILVVCISVPTESSTCLSHPLPKYHFGDILQAFGLKRQAQMVDVVQLIEQSVMEWDLESTHEHMT